MYLIDAGGAVIAGADVPRRLSDEGFRPSTIETILTATADHLVDRVYNPRIVAFTPVVDGAVPASSRWRTAPSSPASSTACCAGAASCS